MTERLQSLLAQQVDNCVRLIDLLNERLYNLEDRLNRLELRSPISQSATPDLSMDSEAFDEMVDAA